MDLNLNRNQARFCDTTKNGESAQYLQPLQLKGVQTEYFKAYVAVLADSNK